MPLDIFDAISQCGRDEYLWAGEAWYPTLEVTHLLACLRRSSWDDRPYARLRRHTLIYGERGMVKSSIAKRFLVDLCSARDLGELETLYDEKDLKKPTMLTMGGQGLSWERMRGSVGNDGNLAVPLLQMANYYFAPELMSFMQHGGDSQKERMDVLNEVLEEGRVTVALVKLAGLQPEKLATALDLCKRFKIRFQPDAGIMQYDVRSALVACSRPFTNRERQTFEDSGFLSRLCISAVHPSDAEVRALWDHLRNAPRSDRGGEVAAFNQKAWNTTFLVVNYPPRHLLDRIAAVYDKVYSRIEQEHNVSSVKLRSMRDIVDMAQMLTARAAARSISEWDYENNGHTIPVLSYTDGDADWVCNFAERTRLMGLYDEWLAREPLDPEVADDKTALHNFMARSGKVIQGTNGSTGRHFLEGADLVKFMTMGGPGIVRVTRTEANQRLGRMVGRGWLRQISLGRYEILVMPPRSE